MVYLSAVTHPNTNHALESDPTGIRTHDVSMVSPTPYTVTLTSLVQRCCRFAAQFVVQLVVPQQIEVVEFKLQWFVDVVCRCHKDVYVTLGLLFGLFVIHGDLTSYSYMKKICKLVVIHMENVLLTNFTRDRKFKPYVTTDQPVTRHNKTLKRFNIFKISATATVVGIARCFQRYEDQGTTTNEHIYTEAGATFKYSNIGNAFINYHNKIRRCSCSSRCYDDHQRQHLPFKPYITYAYIRTPPGSSVAAPIIEFRGRNPQTLASPPGCFQLYVETVLNLIINLAFAILLFWS